MNFYSRIQPASWQASISAIQRCSAEKNILWSKYLRLHALLHISDSIFKALRRTATKKLGILWGDPESPNLFDLQVFLLINTYYHPVPWKVMWKVIFPFTKRNPQSLASFEKLWDIFAPICLCPVLEL